MVNFGLEGILLGLLLAINPVATFVAFSSHAGAREARSAPSKGRGFLRPATTDDGMGDVRTEVHLQSFVEEAKLDLDKEARNVDTRAPAASSEGGGGEASASAKADGPSAAATAAPGWEEMEGNFLRRPPRGVPVRAVVHFLGGAFVGAAPQVTYRYLLEGLARQGFLVVATPYDLGFDYLEVCDAVLDKFDRAAVKLAVEIGAVPVVRRGRCAPMEPLKAPQGLALGAALQAPVLSPAPHPRPSRTRRLTLAPAACLFPLSFASALEVGMGHSCGALLQVLISSLFPDAPRAANALLSFNNKQVWQDSSGVPSPSANSKQGQQ